MQQICEDLKAHGAEVVQIFERVAVEGPSLQLPEENKEDVLPELIIGLVEASLCTPFDLDSHGKKVKAAVQHGRFRDGFPEHPIFEHYDLLREAIWSYLRQKFRYRSRATDAIMRIDAAIDLATRGSLYGYHSLEYGIDGQMEDVVERLAAASPLLKMGIKTNDDRRILRSGSP